MKVHIPTPSAGLPHSLSLSLSINWEHVRFLLNSLRKTGVLWTLSCLCWILNEAQKLVPVPRFKIILPSWTTHPVQRTHWNENLRPFVNFLNDATLLTLLCPTVWFVPRSLCSWLSMKLSYLHLLQRYKVICLGEQFPNVPVSVGKLI